MKTFILLFSFVSVICLISCGKTDSDSEPTTTPTANTPTANTPTGTTPTGTTPTTQTPTGTTPTGTTPTGSTPTPTEHFTLYVPGAISLSVYPHYALTIYTENRNIDKTIIFIQGYHCFKVHKKWLSQIKVKKSIKIKQTLPSGRATYSFNEKVIYEPSRSDYRVGIYKPDKNSDHLIKVEANNPEYLRYKDECRIRAPT